MEPDVMPLHSYSPPPLDDNGDGEVESEEEEFGDFTVGMSCSSLGFADATEPPSSFIKPSTHQPSCSFNHPVEQSQPTSTVNVDIHDYNAEPSLHLTNGYGGRDHNSGASVVGAYSPKEETGFADFTVFTEQTAHPWCCGFSPMDNAEQRNGRVGRTDNSLTDQICESGQEIIMESEPRSHCAHKAKENVKHWERGPSQGHHQPQEAAAAFSSVEEELCEPGDTQREMRGSFNTGQRSDTQEDGEKSNPHTFSLCESATDDLASLCDDLSFEGVSADLEPIVSSLASQDDQTDWDRTDDEGEELENIYRHSDSESEMGFHHCIQHVTQDTFATSKQPHSGTSTEDQFADFTDSNPEHHREQEQAQTADAAVRCLGNLPPSDSFADFCSAPTQEDGDGLWAEFKDQVEGRTWPKLSEPVSSLQPDGEAEEEPDEEGEYGSTQRNTSQVQQLLQATFPEMTVHAVDGEEEPCSLGAVFQARQQPPDGEEAQPELSSAQWIQQEILLPLQDIHSAVGLQFQWGGSHTNRTLLRCLGVDTRNIVFIGTRKQPVTVPAFASSLGMLEPTKDSVPAVCSSGLTVVTAPAGPRDTPAPSTHSQQDELSSSQLDWSSRGLSSSQDGCSALNLDYFGPEEEEGSSSTSSIRSISPPPGVDRELYELTISKLETSPNSSRRLEDTLSLLMSTAKKTSIPVRKPLQDEDELSAEACRLIAALPSLSFMQAKVLMFPCKLAPKGCSSQK
ncbi:aftiphilin-like [Parambassis ranga]|uniref:Aftiphilin-like n=1 Tax=Parambassis ranga TaxID=210632 RepID=A0A6P7JSJ9_9TELE|nr:aftiphilin [Parambassis ranga]